MLSALSSKLSITQNEQPSALQWALSETCLRLVVLAVLVEIEVKMELTIFWVYLLVAFFRSSAMSHDTSRRESNPVKKANINIR